MLFLLELVFLLFASLSLILTKKDYLSPTFLLASAFSVCNVFAILGNQSWMVDIPATIITLFICIFFFILMGELSVFRFNYSSQKILILNPHSLAGNNSIFFVFVFVVIQIIILYLYYSRLIAMATVVGFSGEDLPMYVRVATINYGLHVGVGYAISVPALSAGSLIYFFLFAKKVILEENKSIKNFVFLVPLLVSCGASTLAGARSGFIENAFVAFFMVVYFFKMKDNKNKATKILLVSLITFVVLMAIFLLLGTLTKKVNEENYLRTLYVYGGSSIVAFGSWLDKFDFFNISFFNGVLGAESFSGIRNTLNRFFPFVESSNPFLEFISFDGGSSTNIYTGFRAYIADFGLYGLPLICFAFGLSFSFFYEFLKKNTTPLNLIVYAYFLKTFVYLVFAPSVTSALLTPSQFFWLMWVIVLGFLIVGKSFNKPL